MPTLFNLKTYLREGDRFFLIDEVVGHNREELENAGFERKGSNPAYVILLLEFKRTDAIML